jgi:tetratricopeptide (TPR) repeat protein
MNTKLSPAPHDDEQHPTSLQQFAWFLRLRYATVQLRFRALLSRAGVALTKFLGLKEEIISRQLSDAEQCLASGDLDRAMEGFNIILTLEPHHRGAFYGNLAILVEERRYDAVVQYLDVWLSQGLGYVDIVAHKELIDYLCLMSDTQTASGRLEALREQIGSHFVLDLLAGVISLAENKLDSSATFFHRALEQAPNNADTLSAYGQYLIATNRREEAIEIFEKAVSLEPNLPYHYLTLTSLNYYKSADHEHIQHLRALSENQSLRRMPRIRCHYLLGQVFDHAEKYDDAFFHYKQANDLEFKGHNDAAVASFDELSRCIIDYAVSERFTDRRPSLIYPDDECPFVFIVGMPRSGSTLIEQILASHASVHAEGESAAMIQAVCELATAQEGGYLEHSGRLDEAAVDRAARRYRDDMIVAGSNKRIYTDKQLMNYVHLGAIHIMFPGAKIIHCKRDSIDTCLSCYFQHFAFLPYMNDLVTIGSIYQSYERIMRHWCETLPANILEVEYERLVLDQEFWTRRILEFCGLPWSDDCLSFHLTQRIAHTASDYQVKSPIYSRSIARWKNYEKHLGDLIRILGRSDSRTQEAMSGTALIANDGYAGR